MLNNDSDTFPLRLNVMTSLYDLEKITYAFLYYLESENIFKNTPMSQLQFGLKIYTMTNSLYFSRSTTNQWNIIAYFI